MKQFVRVTSKDETIFEGKILELPFKKEAVVKKSIELFGDDDPCIIHTSFVYKKFAEKLVSLQIEGRLVLSKYPDINFLNFDQYSDVIIHFEGDKK